MSNNKTVIIDGNFQPYDDDNPLPIEISNVSDVVSSVIIFKGVINNSSDFPLVSDVKVGWMYAVNSGVTDDDPTKTNTGLSFISGEEIFWDGSTWGRFGGQVDLSVYVTKVGTPVNEELGVWTGDGTIEGDSNLSWDGSSLVVNGNFNLTSSSNGLTINQTGGSTNNFVAFQSSGTEVAYMDGNQIGMPRGSVGTVSYGFMEGFTYDIDTGMWSPGNNIVAFSCGGTETLRMVAGSTDITGTLDVTGAINGSNLSGNNTGDQASNDFTHDDLIGVHQDVTSGSSPIFNNTNISGNISIWTNDSGYITDYNVTNADINGLDISELNNDSGFTSNDGTVTSVAVSGSDGLEIDSGSPITTDGTIALGVNKSTMLNHLNVEDGADVTDFASIAEVDAGTESSKVVSPDSLQGSKRNIRYLVFNLVAPDSDVETGTNLGGEITIPFSGTILQDDSTKQWLMATNSTAGTIGTMVVDININGSTIMNTNKLDIETGEKSTEDATTQPDLTTTNLNIGDIITIDIDSVHTTPAKGLTVYVAVRED